MSKPTAPPAAKVGWAKKQGRSGLYKNWKKRYFVLKEGRISYYEEADKPETLKVRDGGCLKCGLNKSLFIYPSSIYELIIIDDSPLVFIYYLSIG